MAMSVEEVAKRARERAFAALDALQRAYAEHADGSGFPRASAQAQQRALAAALETLAGEYRADADALLAARVRGAQGTAQQLRQVASRLAGEALEVRALDVIISRPEPPDEPPLEDLPMIADAPPIMSDALAYLAGVVGAYEPPDIHAVEAHDSHEALHAALASGSSDADDWIAQQHDACAECGAQDSEDFRHAAGCSATLAQVDAFLGDPSTGVARERPAPEFVDPPDPSQLWDEGRRGPDRERLNWPAVIAQAATHPQRRAVRSVSQVTSYEDCGVKYALGGSGLGQPSWALIGGVAIHAVIANVEHVLAATSNDHRAAWDLLGPPSALWARHLDVAIANQRERSPDWPLESWRASGRGKEGYDWWRVEGARMVERYLHNRAGMAERGTAIARLATGKPIIEWGFEVHSSIFAAPLRGVVDQALALPDGASPGAYALIRDIKSGASPQLDRLQLTMYALALHRLENIPLNAIRVATLDARKGEQSTPRAVTDLDIHALSHRVNTMHAMESAGHYLPRVSTFCSGCEVRDLCPVGPQ